MQKYNSRKDVPEKYKWDLTPFFKDDNEFNKTYDKVLKTIAELKEYVNCTKDVQKLYEFLNKNIECSALCEDIYVYAYLINDQELGISSSIERKNRAEMLLALFSNATNFFAPELLKLTQNEYDKLFKDNEKLLEYKRALDRIYREKEHILTENEENIVTDLINAMNHYDDISSNILNNENDYGKVKLDDGTTVTIAPTNYRHLMRNKDVKIRKKVYNLFNKKISQYSGTISMLLNSYIAMNDKMAHIRHYKDSWSEKLFSWNLNDKVFKTLVNTTENNLDVLQKYYKLKKDMLGLDVLHGYDMNLDFVDNNKEYSIEDAQNIIRKSIKPLGSDYASKFEKIITNRYIDYCQYKGKCSGGYSFATVLNDSRILLSFNGILDSVSTIAHESGHNVHHQYVKENNPVQYREPSTLICEVMSLTNECLLSNYLMENGTTKEEKLSGISNILGVIVSNLYGAVREGKMEQDMYQLVHKGGTITKDYMDKLTRKSLKKYYGSEVKMDKYFNNSWVTRSHYYMHFYLYSYAICISVASYVSSKIINGDKDMLSKYLEFIKCGSDKWPSEAFQILGINLEDKEVYEGAIKYFDTLIDKYYKIYNDSEVK